MPHTTTATQSSLSPQAFPRFHDAYAAVLADLTQAPGHINTRGNAGPERLNAFFQLDNPASRIPMFASHKANIVFDLAEVLGFLGGQEILQ